MTISEKGKILAFEESILAPYAAKSSETRGRKFPEDKLSSRSEFQRDRDRVIHSTAFRRLEYKTQVFVNHEGDHYRTRLTHTLEVSQIARSVGRALKLNQDLIEAIVLAHDLGHTPFGHSGEHKMNELTLEHGKFKFEHNEQSFRVVDFLETRYPLFRGLNLTYEVREGIIRHNTPYDKPSVPPEFHPEEMPSLEAQIVDLADEIAYNNHDLDDGISSSMLDEESVDKITLWNETHRKVVNLYKGKTFKELKNVTISSIITALINDVIAQTLQNISKYSVMSLIDVRKFSGRLVNFSDEMSSKNKELKKYLYENLYKHSRVIRMEEKAKRILKDLFVTYMDSFMQIPPDFRNKFTGEEKPRIVCDYIAGMTDRFANEEHKKLFDPHEKV